MAAVETMQYSFHRNFSTNPINSKNNTHSPKNKHHAIPLNFVHDQTSNSEPFIEISEFENLFNDKNALIFLIILDCRLFKDFQMQHIKNSQHINCRDKITKRRLASKKLTVKDLISCEETKRLILQQQEAIERFNNNCSNNQQVEFIIYDEDTSDMSDLQLEMNPLKIVLDNINSSLKARKAKILRGGFKRFVDACPQFCVKNNSNNSKRPNNFTLPPNNAQFKPTFSLYEDPNDLSIDNEKMTQILPYLYLGNESDSSNHEILKSEGITHILNVTRNIPFHLSHIGEYVYKRISVNDALDQNLRQFFDDAYEFIECARKNNQKVLVHCQAGISRSPTIVIAYLMKKQNLSMNDAYNLVSDKRKIIGPNLLFMSQLSEYDEFLTLKRKENNQNIFQGNHFLQIKVSTSLNFLENGKSFSKNFSTSSLCMDISK